MVILTPPIVGMEVAADTSAIAMFDNVLRRDPCLRAGHLAGSVHGSQPYRPPQSSSDS